MSSFDIPPTHFGVRGARGVSYFWWLATIYTVLFLLSCCFFEFSVSKIWIVQIILLSLQHRMLAHECGWRAVTLMEKTFSNFSSSECRHVQTWLAESWGKSAMSRTSVVVSHELRKLNLHNRQMTTRRLRGAFLYTLLYSPCWRGLTGVVYPVWRGQCEGLWLQDGQKKWTTPFSSLRKKR